MKRQSTPVRTRREVNLTSLNVKLLLAMRTLLANLLEQWRTETSLSMDMEGSLKTARL